MSEIVRIAGFDPGLRYTGYGIVEFNYDTCELRPIACGALHVQKKIKGLDAIMDMTTQINELSNHEIWSTCDHIVIEVPMAFFYQSHSNTALIPVAVIAGGLLSVFHRENNVIPVHPHTWNRCKKKDKSQQQILDDFGDYNDWEYLDKPKYKGHYEHIIDAIGMAHWAMKEHYIE